jgi:hypothetical protein
MVSVMRAALATVVMAHEPTEPWGATAKVGCPGPELELGFQLEPLTATELDEVFRGGEAEADLYERRLVWAARAHAAIDLRIAEGLHALTKGTRLLELCFNLDDYAREVLDIGEAAAKKLARLGGRLQTRPLLREAMDSGRVQLRAAQTVAKVAVGDEEAAWVERASRETVRELEAAVRSTGVDPDDEEEPWFRLRTHLPPNERAVVDLAMKCAGRVLPGSKPLDQWEAMAQEWLGSFSTDAGENDERRALGPAFRLLGPRESELRAALEAETERWSLLPPVAGLPAPDVRFEETDTADQIDHKLHWLAKLQKRVDDVLGYCAHVIRKTRIYRHFGFRSFRHYVTERLQLPVRAVEQRAELEERLWESPALREAKRQKVSYEKLRLLATLPEAEIGSWTPRARARTCVGLRRRLEGEKERQMRSANRLGVSWPRRIAVLVAAAVQSVRGLVGRLLPTGTCLAIIAAHFVEIWKHFLKAPRTRAQKVRERDGFCLTPGCSRPAGQSHHVEFRSRGGSDDLGNQGSECPFHHLGCIHGGYLTVEGEAPDHLTWLRKGTVFTGMAEE